MVYTYITHAGEAKQVTTVSECLALFDEEEASGAKQDYIQSVGHSYPRAFRSMYDECYIDGRESMAVRHVSDGNIITIDTDTHTNVVVGMVSAINNRSVAFVAG